MKLINGSCPVGARRLIIGPATATLFSASTAQAETIFTINGVDVDSSVVDMYFNSRLANQAAQATPQQREVLMGELRDIYILATQDSANEIAQQEQVAAQLSLQRHSILAQAVAAEMLEGIEVSEDEMRAAYDEQVELMPPLEYKARHILVESQAEAMDIIEELDGGADFQELAKTRSTGPSGPSGGDLGWFSPTQMVAPFTAAVESMEDGESSSTPVQTQFGWHVILREESRESVPPPYESSKENVRAMVQQQKFQEALAALRDAAE